MHKILSVVFALLILCGGISVSAEERVPNNMALLELGSAGEGSILNYYSLRVVMQYCNAAGVCEGVMFDGVVITHPQNTDTREKADAFLGQIAGDSGILSVAELIVDELIEGEFVDEGFDYPIFISFPNVSRFNISSDEKEEFCKYYVNTLVGAVEAADYSHITLAGVYFDKSFSGNPSFKNYCMSLIKDKGLLCIESTDTEKDVLTDRAYSYRDNDGEQEGVELYLGGVPSSDDSDILRSFLEQVYTSSATKPKLFTFEAYNNLYDCASALDQNEPNHNARLTYDCVYSILAGDIDSTRDVYDSLKDRDKNGTQVDENSEETENNANIGLIICGIVIVFCLAYIILILFRKGKR